MIKDTNTFQITFYVPLSRQRYQVVVEADTSLTATNICVSRFEVPGARLSIEVCKQVPNDREVVNITDRYTNSRAKMPTTTEELDSITEVVPWDEIPAERGDE